MATITIRNLDDSVKKRLRIQAASHDRSMEEEARSILERAVRKDEDTGGLGSRIWKRFTQAGGIEIPLADREQNPRKPELE